ncbi:hypothetical protein WJX72_001941 [[Myrmecia] bisecta]|uniref:AB hydrolase-1 domain-containing protein n=1 Tax=[Myrmecia] bisecta TaxID=41462 RepID=A0AAW1QPZ0_9CHLO
MAEATAERMAQAEQAENSQLPWWVRYMRWRPTSHEEGVKAERKLLSLCSSPVNIQDVPVGPKKHEYMHTITSGAASAPNLVCIPGYGAGASFFFRNVDGLSRNYRTHLVDLLGTGLSGRPTFRAKNLQQTEDFFLNALSKWRQEQGIDKMVLVGHSLGGFLAATYALRHPEHVEHLVLVCPAGVAKKPEDYRDPHVVSSPWTWRGQLFRLAKTMWNFGMTPGVVVRSLGPWGPNLIAKYSRNRFKEGLGLTEDEVAAFEQYFYHIMAANGSGEFALRHILQPFAWAAHPLEGRLQDLKVPVTFIYGEYDWMDPKGGKRVCADIKASRGPLSAADLHVAEIPSAGHYPFLDQPELFLQALVQQTKYLLPQPPQSMPPPGTTARPTHLSNAPLTDSANSLNDMAVENGVGKHSSLDEMAVENVVSKHSSLDEMAVEGGGSTAAGHGGGGVRDWKPNDLRMGNMRKYGFRTETD